MKQALLGICIILAAVWGMFYGYHVFPYGTWQSIPTYITCCVVWIVGVVVTFDGSNE